MLADQASAIPPSHSCALVTPGAWQPALRTGFAALGLAALFDLPRAHRADRVMALGGAAAAGWYLVRGCDR